MSRHIRKSQRGIGIVVLGVMGLLLSAWPAHAATGYGLSNIFTIDNRTNSAITVDQRACGIFLSQVSFNNTFRAVVNDWGEGSPGNVTFALGDQSVTIPYSGAAVETSAFDMGDLPSGPCAVTTNLLVTAKNDAGHIAGQVTVPLRCVDRPWFMPPPATDVLDILGTRLIVPSPFQWNQEITYQAGIKFMNLDATWYGKNALFENYGGTFSGGEIQIEYNGAKGEFELEIMTDLATEPKPKWGALWRPTTHKKKISGKGDFSLGVGLSAKTTIDRETGCPGSGLIVCGEGEFGYEWKLVPIGPLFGIPGLWFTGKAGFEINPEVCFDVMEFGLDNLLPLTAVDVDLRLTGQGGLELGIPYFASVFGGLEGSAEGKIHVLGEPVATCWDLPYLADLDFDLSIVGFARLALYEWELGRYVIVQWSCPTSSQPALMMIPIPPADPGEKPARRPYLENGEPYAVFRPQDAQSNPPPPGPTGEMDEALVSNINVDSTPNLASRGNLSLLVTGEDDPGTVAFVEHEVYAVFRDGSLWATRARITDNAVPDILPAAGYTADGKPLAAWTSVPGATGTETLSQLKPMMEIAYASYDLSAQAWSAPTVLTTDGTAVDVLPQVVAGEDGSTNLIWLHSADNSIPMAPRDPLGTPVTLMVSRWNGTAFGLPETLFEGCDAVGPVRYARDGAGSEFLIWTRDTDGDLGTPEDREVIETHTVGGAWTTPQALTANSEADVAVGLVAREQAVMAFYTAFIPQEVGETSVCELRQRIFNGSSWSTESLQIDAPAILAPSFAVRPDGTVSCVYVGPSLRTSGKALFYASSPTGMGSWSVPQEMSTGPAPSTPTSAYAADNLQVAYVSARSSTQASPLLKDAGADPQSVYDVRFLEHEPFTDLWIESPDIAMEPADPNLPWAGQPVTVTVTVHLSGDFDQSGVVVDAYDGNPLADGVKIGETTVDLVAGGHAVATFVWQVPDEVTPRVLYSQVDPQNNILELNEDNNVAQVSAGTVNLRAVSLEPAFYENDLVGLGLAVRNTGSAAAIDVSYEIRRDSETGPVVVSGTIPQVDAGQRAEAIVPWDLSLTEAGMYQVYLVADPSGLIEEDDEEDNVISNGVAVLPDLQAQPWTARVDGDTAFVTVRNIGAKPSAPTVVRVSLGEWSLGEGQVPSLNPADSIEVTVALAAAVEAGRIALVVNPDSDGTDEVTLTNNAATLIRFAPGDFEPDGDVDLNDLATVVDQWLESSGVPSADIAPEPVDGRVDLADLGRMAEYWLSDFNE